MTPSRGGPAHEPTSSPGNWGTHSATAARVVAVGVHDDEATALVRRELRRDGPIEVGHDDIGDEPRREARGRRPVGRDHREPLGPGGSSPERGRPGAGSQAHDHDLPPL